MLGNSWDTIIVGQGLAGTTLAWHLKWAGQKVLLLDACSTVTSSKIAAGLITPITGQRMVQSEGYDEYLSVAKPFYERIEQQTSRVFFHNRTALRLFKSNVESANWAKRISQPAYQSHLLIPQPNPLIEPRIADASGGGFAMNTAQLDVAAYLEASRLVLPCEQMELDWDSDVLFRGDGVTVGPHSAELIVSCEGFTATRNPHFSALSFNAAKGDILTVRFHLPVPPVSIHRGLWVAPTSDPEVFLVGSTYNWEKLDEVPEPSARSQIECKLKEFIHVPYTVLDHRAAVRPIIHKSMPLIGRHPTQDRLGYFNGLGSKGSLLAPWYANCLCDHLVGNLQIPNDVNIRSHV
ncbi:MAG: FAD-dependent oxidoreductase [Hyphomicrobiales bacterium]